MDSSPREKKSGGWKQRGDSTTWLSLGTRNHEEAERHSVKGARLGWERGGGGRSTFLGHCLCTSKFVWSGVWTMEKRKGDWFTLWYNPLSRSRSPRSPSASASSASTTYSTDTDVGVVVSLPLSISLSLFFLQLFPFYDSVVFAWRRGFTIFLYPPSRARWRTDSRRRRNGNDASKRLWRRPPTPYLPFEQWMNESLGSIIQWYNLQPNICIRLLYINSCYSRDLWIFFPFSREVRISVVIGNDRIGYSINKQVLCWTWKSIIESVYNYLCGMNYEVQVYLFDKIRIVQLD